MQVYVLTVIQSQQFLNRNAMISHRNQNESSACGVTARSKFLVTLVLLQMVSCLPTGISLLAQSPASRLPATVPLYRDDQPPGVIGAIQMQRDSRLCGYYQPVEFRGPEGMQVSFATDGLFGDPQDMPATAALLVGVPYRIKLTGIPLAPETELFPTIELIDRTYPPAEKAHRFPVPIEFDAIDLDSAMQGDLVMRVIYLEDSQNAEAVSYAGGPQRVYDVAPQENMLQTADVFGRPLAIMRMGSRVPDMNDGTAAMQFLFGCPPVVPVKSVPDAERLYDEGSFQRFEPPRPMNEANNSANGQRAVSSGRISDYH